MKKYIGIALFAGALVIGLLTYKNYGISWDEGFQRHLGIVTYHYFSYSRDSLEACNNKNYGAAFEYPLILLEKGLHLEDSRDIYFMRHLVTHLFFLLGALAFFFLIDYYYKNKLLAIIGFLLLVSHPVIYSHSFYNSKDIVFLSMYCICYFLAVVAFDKNKMKYYILLGVACGILTNLRVMGCLLTLCLMLFFLTDYIKAKDDKEKRKQIRKYFWGFFATTLVVLYIVSPYLYPNPVQNFDYVFRDMASHYPVQLIFNGAYVYPNTIPYYAITVFSITTPIVYLLLGFAGAVILAMHFFRKPLQAITDRKERNIVLFAIGFFQPLLSILLFHSVIFDGWRHLFFIYPSFVLLAIYGLSYLIKTKGKWIYVAIVFIGIGSTVTFIAINYPFENVYFNRLAGNTEPENLRKKWETDYWGNSYYQALQYIVQHDSSSKIYVLADGWVAQENSWLLKPEDRKRVVFTEGNPKPDYVACWYKNNLGDHDELKDKEVFAIKVLNSRIMSVFKLKQ